MIEENKVVGEDIVMVKALFFILEKRGVKINPYLKRAVLVCFAYRHFLFSLL